MKQPYRRYFFAIHLNKEVARFLNQKINCFDKINKKEVDLKKILVNNYHITLLYIEQSSKCNMENLIQRIDNHMKQNSWNMSFYYQIKNIHAFPKAKPKYLSAGVDIDKAGINLRQQLMNQCDICNIKYDRKLFIPHISLAQINRSDFKIKLLLPSIIQCQAKCFDLFQSPENGSRNRLYQCIHRFELNS